MKLIVKTFSNGYLVSICAKKILANFLYLAKGKKRCTKFLEGTNGNSWKLAAACLSACLVYKSVYILPAFLCFSVCPLVHLFLCCIFLCCMCICLSVFYLSQNWFILLYIVFYIIKV